MTTYVATCDGNTPDPATTLDALCDRATTSCAAGEVQYWVYRSPPVEPRQWARSGVACLSVAQAAAGTGGNVIVIGVTEEDFRRLPLPPAVSNVEPPTGRILVNVPTNAYANAAVVTLPTTVLATAVEVRATPVAFAWAWGDGATTGPSSDPGAAYPRMRHTHAYDAAGHYALTLTTTYTGEFSVAGGPWLPIDGTAEVVSPAQPLTAHTATSHLVADNLS